MKLKKHLFNSFPLVIVLSGYAIFILNNYWMFPVSSDGLAFCEISAFPGKALYIFDRFFNFYIAKIITLLFNNFLTGFALISFFYHVGIIIFAYLIAQKLAGKVQGLLAAILTALSALFFVYATQYISDAPCLFFGLGALYFSIGGNDSSKNYLRYIASGFFLASSILSKFFGIVFIIPLLINLWPTKLFKKIIYLCIGILIAMLFIAICDYLWVGDLFYHLNPHNYLMYKNFLSSKMAEIKDPSQGRPLEITDGWFIAYLIFFAAFLFHVSSFFEFRKNLDWKKRGMLSFALVGLSLVIIFARTSLLHPGFWVHPQYNYCLFIPWIISFCSILTFKDVTESDRTWTCKLNIIAYILSFLFIIALLTTRDSHYYNWEGSPFGRFFYIASLWILIFAIALILVAGKFLRNNVHQKMAVLIFLIGSFGIMWHNANWTHKISADSYLIKTYFQTKSFLRKYRELSKKAPVVPIDCNVSNAFELRASLLLSKLASQKSLNFFYRTENLKEILKNISIPFYILTKYETEFLTHEANSIGLNVAPVLDGTYFDCSFYQIAKAEIEVNIPEEGSVLYMNERMDIRWVPPQEFSDVMINLYKGKKVARLLANLAENDGKHWWKIYNDLEEGTDYRIKIDADLFSGYSGYFTIKQKR